MPTMNPRITFTVSEELMKRIDEYRFDNRLRNQTAAIVDLINKGFASLTGEPVHQEQRFTENEVHLIDVYRSADDGARFYAVQMLENNPSQKKESRA